MSRPGLVCSGSASCSILAATDMHPASILPPRTYNCVLSCKSWLKVAFCAMQAPVLQLAWYSQQEINPATNALLVSLCEAGTLLGWGIMPNMVR